MSLNLAELQQKMNRVLFNTTRQLQVHFDLFFSTTPQDISLEQYNEEGTLETFTLPNYAKLQLQSAPLGSVLLYTGNTIPESWLACDGSELNTADFPDLFVFSLKGQTEPQPPFAPGTNIDRFLLPDIPSPVPGTIYIIKVRIQ